MQDATALKKKKYVFFFEDLTWQCQVQDLYYGFSAAHQLSVLRGSCHLGDFSWDVHWGSPSPPWDGTAIRWGRTKSFTDPCVLVHVAFLLHSSWFIWEGNRYKNSYSSTSSSKIVRSTYLIRLYSMMSGVMSPQKIVNMNLGDSPSFPFQDLQLVGHQLPMSLFAIHTETRWVKYEIFHYFLGWFKMNRHRCKIAGGLKSSQKYEQQQFGSR